jgi:hypothetical protein
LEAVAPVEHEDLERWHAVRHRERVHLVDVRPLDGRQMVPVVAPVPPGLVVRTPGP